MWTTSTSLMIARLTGSALSANHHLGSLFALDHRSISSTNESTNVVKKMRELRGRSAYALFLKDSYREMSAKDPDLKLPDASRKMADVWKTLPEETKQAYVKKSQDQKVHYEQEKQSLSANDLQIVDADQKAKRLQQQFKKTMAKLPTKRPRTAFSHFLSSLDRGEADIGTFMKGASQRWSQIPVEEKQKFIDLHEEERLTYIKALAAWEQESKK